MAKKEDNILFQSIGPIHNEPRIHRNENREFSSFKQYYPVNQINTDNPVEVDIPLARRPNIREEHFNQPRRINFDSPIMKLLQSTKLTLLDKTMVVEFDDRDDEILGVEENTQEITYLEYENEQLRRELNRLQEENRILRQTSLDMINEYGEALGNMQYHFASQRFINEHYDEFLRWLNDFSYDYEVEEPN